MSSMTLLQMQMERERDLSRQAERARVRLAAAVEVLRTHEWGAVGHCHECARPQAEGHTKTCRWARAMWLGGDRK